VLGAPLAPAAIARQAAGQRPPVEVRGIYGGVPGEIFAAGKTLADYGVNAVFIGSGLVNDERLALLRSHGARVYAEFNTMHFKHYVDEHPDAAPVGVDGKPSPPPDGWQGACPTHPGYRANRMQTFRELAAKYAIDGVWLDYHHAHASWERAEPLLPDTCFCPRCLAAFQRQAGIQLPPRPAPDLAPLLLTKHRAPWVKWRCGVFTDWVREFRALLGAARPGALLGTFHNPWSDTDFDGARLEKLAIDLKAQARYLDVFSTMPYHARFGHPQDPAWISRQTAWLGQYLGITGRPGERHKIWPIVQLSDWGETVPVEQVGTVLDHGTRAPATGVMVFAWGSLRRQPEKVEEMGRFYRTIMPAGERRE